MSHPPRPQDLPSDARGWERLRRPVWVFDPVSCRGLYANPPALELWDAADQAELLSRDFSKLSPAVRTRTERLAVATAGGEAVTERWTFYPRGQPVTVQTVVSSLILKDGRAVLLFEAAPADVGESERRAVEALRHTSSLITLFDAEGAAVFANPAAFAAYGDGGPGFIDRFSDPIEGVAALTRVLAGDVLAELRQVNTLAGERYHHLDARQVLDPVTGRSSVLLSERDVTGQVEAERALLAQTERAEVAVAKERFLANMSHELRTPLNAVLGFAGLLAATDLDPLQAGHLGRITSAGSTLLEIINDVITLRELDGGEMTLEAAPFEPAAVLAEAFKSVEAAALAKGLVLDLQIADDGASWVVGDAARLGKAALAYLSNALKFTETGQIVLRLDAQPAGDGMAELTISVSDTGPGIDEATQARLFRRFSQGDDSRGKRFGGSGLGLAIAKELIGLMGGEVGVDSRPGEGARFWLRVALPLAEAAADLDAVDDGAQEGERMLKVLYADDHDSNRVLVQAVLVSQGQDCDTVNDGAEAVRAVLGGDYDLVLMDIQMPVMDGVEATRAIRALPGPKGAIPILALTANTLSDQLETYAAVGMNDCIAKPVNIGELLTKTLHWAAAASQGDESAAA